MAMSKNVEHTGRKTICVTIFSQPFPLKKGDNEDLEKSMLEDQYGARSDVDADYLKKVFRSYYSENADVKLQNQLTEAQIKKYIRKLGQTKKCEEYECFFFVFLTYLSYENTGTLYSDERIHLYDGLCSMQEFYDEIKMVEAMRMKPKIFIIQADDITLLDKKLYIKGDDETKKTEHIIKIPQDADRLVIMSEIPQKLANRTSKPDEPNPSFLIKALGETLYENSCCALGDREDLLSLTITINQKVGKRIDELKKLGVVRAEDMMVPLTTSTLTTLVNI